MAVTFYNTDINDNVIQKQLHLHQGAHLHMQVDMKYILHTYLHMKMGQSVTKRRYIKLRLRRITPPQKKCIKHSEKDESLKSRK